MENQMIPANLHYNSPRKGVDSLEKGRLKVVCKNTPLQDNKLLIAISGFGFGGSNCHVLLESNQKTKINEGLPKDDLPRLVCVSGRTEEAVLNILDDLKKRKLDAEYVRLYHHGFSKNFKGHFYRGSTILSKNGEIMRSSNYYNDRSKVLCLYLTDFSQNYVSKMFKELVEVPLFERTIKKIHDILNLKHKISITEIFSETSSNEFKGILGSLVLQIVLVEVLRELNIQIDHVVPNGLSKIICDYFENNLPLEKAVLMVYQVAKNGVDHQKRKDLTKNGNIKSNSLKKLDKNTIILNIGDESLEKKSSSRLNISFGEFNEKQNTFIVFLKVLGRLYELGKNPQIHLLYPEIEFPVSKKTPMIAPLIKWDHKRDWHVDRLEVKDNLRKGLLEADIDLTTDWWGYISGHVIDERNLFPATGYLYIVWDAIQRELVKQGILDSVVVFENCKFLRATTLIREKRVILTVMIQPGSGFFEVTENSLVLVTGKLTVPRKITTIPVNLDLPEDSIAMQNKDVYKELRLRGYNYSGEFKKIQECSGDLIIGHIQWNSNWITFIDNMLQLKILTIDSRLLFVPTSLTRLSIDEAKHKLYVQSFQEETPNLPVHLHKDTGIIRCGGIEIFGLKASSISRKKIIDEPVLEKYQFTPNETDLTLEQSVRVNLQIILENLLTIKVKVAEVRDDEDSQVIAPIVQEVLTDMPLIQPEIIVCSHKNLDLPNITVTTNNLSEQVGCDLVVGTNLLEGGLVFDQALSVIKENGYVLSRESLDYQIPKQDNLDILTVHKTGEETIVLIKKRQKIETPQIIEISNDEHFIWLKELQDILNKTKNVLIYVQNQPLSGVLGLVNCIRREPGCDKVKCCFINDKAPPFDLSDPFYRKQIDKNLAINVWKNGKWGTYRHILLEKTTTCVAEHCLVNSTVMGDLSSLTWMQGPLNSKMELSEEEQLVYIYYSALNFRDVMVATRRIAADIITQDRIKQEYSQGFEFSGRTKDGKRVMGMIEGNCLATMVTAKRTSLWPVPDKWTLAEAATIPAVYCTVIYAFFIRANLKRGHTILIHSGTGGVGLAAIGLALHVGCKVFVTVGTKEKREFLKEKFPQLTDREIGNSRDTSFEQMVYKGTKGRGVDFVLNSLVEEKLQASVRCLAQGGNFLEIGKFDLATNKALQLLFLEKEATFHGLMLDMLLDSNPAEFREIERMLFDLIGQGAVTPLPRKIFEKDESESAFRFMTTGKHMGKVLVKIRDEEPEKKIVPVPKPMRGLVRSYFQPQCTQIIVGGLGGFGLELADWMILRGARKLVLTSRTGITKGYQSYRINIWKSYGVIIKICTDDILKSGCEKLLKEANDLGTVESIFNLALVLRDAVLENQNEESFKTSFAPKAFATEKLDAASRILCPRLKNFVVFSSVSCGRGNVGQTNYGMANSIMERICEVRRMQGLPGLAIQWGVVGDVGIVADMQENLSKMEIGGTLPQKITNCLEVLDNLLNQECPVVSSMLVAQKKRGAGGGLVTTIAQIMGIKDIKTVSLHTPLAELGMDSMTGVEIQQTLEREFQILLSPQDVRSLTLNKLVEFQDNTGSDQVRVVERKEEERENFKMLLGDALKDVNVEEPFINLGITSKTDIPKLIILPGIEGTPTAIERLGVNLTCPAVCLQYNQDKQKDTIEEMALEYLSIIKKKIMKSEPFHIVGYSFGTLLGLEIINILESEGYSGDLVCIEGSPFTVRKLVESQMNTADEALFQTTLICLLLGMYTTQEFVEKHKQQIHLCKTFDEKLIYSMGLLPDDTESYKGDKLILAAKSLYSRLKAVKSYRPNYKLKTSVSLFKAATASFDGAEKDFGLSSLCEHEVKVQTLQGNHVTILENPELAQYLNA